MQVSVLMGSDSDWKVVQEACKVLSNFDVDYDVHVLSAHRTPSDLMNYIAECGCKIYICAAGKSAHLAGVVAAHTTNPVIGIPLSASMDGMDALLSTVQMPPGIPVATVAVDGATNAAVLAVQMLALSDEDLKQKILSYRSALRDSVLAKDKTIQYMVMGIKRGSAPT